MVLSSMGLFMVILSSMMAMILGIMLLPLDSPLVIISVLSAMAVAFIVGLMLGF
jgi:hypothetical protein